MFTPAIRRSIQRAAWMANASRCYSAKGDAFGKKEKAAEDQYIRQHEQEQLKKLREKLEQTKKEVEELETKLKPKKA